MFVLRLYARNRRLSNQPRKSYNSTLSDKSVELCYYINVRLAYTSLVPTEATPN
jgi:hypothetical protein